MCSIVSSAIGGENVGETIEGLARYPISVRYPRDSRLAGATARSADPDRQRPADHLGNRRQLKISDGPPMLKSENARPSGWIYVRDRDLSSVVADSARRGQFRVKLTPGLSIAYSGQFEYLERANARLKLVVPATLMIIFVLLYLTFRRFDEAALTWPHCHLLWSAASGSSMPKATTYRLPPVSGSSLLRACLAEFGVVMLYLKQAVSVREQQIGAISVPVLEDAIREGAVLRVRPKAMTVAVILAGLIPILWGSGTGSEVMSRIAAPMVGGMITAPLLSMFVIPAAYRLMRGRQPKANPA
jgi:Cu(I)/Ag(I) efflux system membrane protein CusA/SilA